MRCFAVLLIVSLCLDAGEVLTPVQLNRSRGNAVSDASGCRWDFEPRNGSVNDGFNDCFDSGMMLLINGQQFQCQQPMTTKDGELVLQGPDDNGLSVTRRVRVEQQLGVVRYLEIVSNTSKQPRTITLIVQSCLGSNAPSVVSTSGAPFAGGGLGAKDVGIFANQQGNGSRPSVLFIVGTAKATVAPQITCNDRRQFSVQYQLSVPAGQRLAVVHLVAQRQAPPDVAKESAALFKAIPKMGIPSEVKRQIVNLRLQAETDVVVGGLPALDRWCEARGLNRGGEDMLLTGSGDGQQARGAVRGSSITVTAPTGRQVVPLAEIAGLVGASRAGVPGRLFLRSGEVLVGELSANDLALVAGGGSLTVDPANTPGLVLRGDRRDGLDAGAGLIGLPDGDLLVLASAPAGTTLVGSCGAVTVDFAALTSIVRQRGERLGWDVAWIDGTRLSGFLDGKPLALATRRRGAITLPVHELEGFAMPGGKPPEELDRVDHAELVGGDRVVGALAGASLALIGQAGPVSVETTRVRSVTRNEDGAFVVELVGGGQVVGTAQGAGLTVVRPDGTLTVPWPMLDRWTKAEQEEPEPPEAPPADPRLAKPVQLQVDDIPLGQAAAVVAGQLKLTVAFASGLDPAALPHCSVDLESGPASAALDAVVRDSGFGYRLEGDRLIIEPVGAEPAKDGAQP